MVREIRIYVEGGGQGKDTKMALKEGMSRFLVSLRNLARAKHVKWSIIVCGSRSATFRDFCNGRKSNPGATNLLLVDAESAITAPTCSQHLVHQDGWNMTGINDDDIHLMVQVMENWLIADVNTLAAYYGSGFNRGAIPGTTDVETVTKPNVERALENATQRTQKGRYHKIRHGPDILGQLNESLVRRKAAHCDRLFDYIENLI